MRANALKQKLAAGARVYGPFLKILDPAVVEICGHAGFDFVIIDLEHGPGTIETVQNHVRAAEAVGITPIVRVTENAPGRILRALDIGAQGIEIPQIGSRADAEKAAGAARYHPDGARGVCRFVRAADYSAMDRAAYFEQANRETLVIVHIEGVEGVSNLEEILSVKGIDVVFLGPYDLSQACGVPGRIEHPKVVEKMRHAVELATAAGVVVGTFVDTVENARTWGELGVQYLSYSVDVGILCDACKALVARLKGG